MGEALPEKPAFGSPCNGCGLCCRMERCKVSVMVVGKGPGPCPMLEYADGRTWCGLLKHPEQYVSPLALMMMKRRCGVGAFQAELAFTLAIAAGCDSD